MMDTFELPLVRTCTVVLHQQKGRDRGGGLGHPQGAVDMVAARLDFEKAMVGTRRFTPHPDCMDSLLLSPC